MILVPKALWRQDMNSETHKETVYIFLEMFID